MKARHTRLDSPDIGVIGPRFVPDDGSAMRDAQRLRHPASSERTQVAAGRTVDGLAIP
jgi:hypothetical protein